jgi:UDP-N-acetylmuramate--alanine ligase
MVVDDYGHHPTEIAAVIAATKAINRRLMVVFQPHRYSRTADLMQEFGAALSGADEVVLTDIYAAGEPPIDGVTVDALGAVVRSAARGPVHVIPALDALPAAVAGLARAGDLIVTMGAGSIGGVADRILAAIGERTAERSGR